MRAEFTMKQEIGSLAATKAMSRNWRPQGSAIEAGNGLPGARSSR